MLTRIAALAACLTLASGCAVTDVAEPPRLAVEPPHIDGVTHDFVEVNGVRLHVAEAGEGPLLLLLHGFPELWYGWRDQFGPLADAGYHVVAPDLRGFGESDQPADMEAYDAADLCGDVTGLMDHYGAESAVVVGHDWGSAVAFQCAQLAPERYRILVTVSVPYGRGGDTPPLEGLRAAYGENFFYMLYFQEDAAEAELNARAHDLFTRMFSDRSVERTPALITDPLASGGGFVDRMSTPLGPTDWMSESEIDYFTASYERAGFLGGLNYYRNLDRSWTIVREQRQLPVNVPAHFIAGEFEFLIQGRSPEDLQAAMAEVTPDIGVTIVPGAGHWIQWQAADEFNAVLLEFLAEAEARLAD